MKRIFFVCLALVICLTGCKDSTKRQISQFSPVKQTGTVPAEYTGAVLEKELLLKALPVSDGYLLAENGVEKYDCNGNPVWQKGYPFLAGDCVPQMNFYAADNDGFLISYGIARRQKEDGTSEKIDPVLAKCDKDGNLIWQKTYAGFSETTIVKAFCFENGSVITIGYTEEKVAGKPGEANPDDIYLSLLDEDGQLLSERYYGGTDFDFLYDAEYIEGIGLIALGTSQSRDGTFSASRDGSGEDIVMRIDSTLAIQWFKTLGTLLGPESMAVTEEGIYLLDLQNNFKKLDFDGQLLHDRPLYEKSQSVGIVGRLQQGFVIQNDTKLLFYNDLSVSRELDFDAGWVRKIVETDSGFIVVSIHSTGKLPTPAYVSSMWSGTEIVYSCYSSEGGLLWRNAHDNTPKEIKNYSPEN